MQDTLEDLKSRVRDLEKENASLRCKVKEMRERVDTRTERSDTDICRKQRAAEKEEEDGNQLARRVMQWKENNVKRLRCERKIEELSEVSSCTCQSHRYSTVYLGSRAQNMQRHSHPGRSVGESRRQTGPTHRFTRLTPPGLDRLGTVALLQSFVMFPHPHCYC